MKIWIFNHYALKSSESGGTRHHDLARELVKKGHQVCIFASSFLHYKFKWRSKKKYYKEKDNGVYFQWLWTLPYKGNGLKRIANMLSYFFVVIIKSLFTKEKPDVIIGSSVHLFACLAAYIVSKLKKTNFVVEIRDLWPQTLIDIGAISEKSMTARFFSTIELFVYKKANAIIVLLPGAVDYIESKGISINKIHYLPNGISLKKRELINNNFSLEKELNILKEKYNGIAMYMGSHGLANALDTILDAAEKDVSKDIAFVFIGDGPEKEKLIKKANCISNIYFYDSVPKDEVYATLNGADVLLISMLNSPLYKYGISLNKIFDYLLIGKPIVFAGEVSNDIVKYANAGSSIKPGDPVLLLKAVKKMVALSQMEKEKIKKSSFQYVSHKNNIELLAEDLISICVQSGGNYETNI
jgi:glycosyltransferase involved in cell wall biosynthesis